MSTGPKRQSGLLGGDPSLIEKAAKVAALTSISNDKRRLCKKVVEKAVRHAVLSKLPKQDDLDAEGPIAIQVDVAPLLNEEMAAFDTVIAEGDWLEAVRRYPVRETPALNAIATALSFRSKSEYVAAVKKLLLDDPSALTSVRAQFASVSHALAVT